MQQTAPLSYNSGRKSKCLPVIPGICPITHFPPRPPYERKYSLVLHGRLYYYWYIRPLQPLLCLTYYTARGEGGSDGVRNSTFA